MTPVEPRKNAIGPKTAASTRPMPIKRARDLVHGLAGRLPGREPLLAHDPLDVLDHDDGVVDQQADREHHREHGQHVDREAEQPQDGEGPEDDDRHGDRRDQRRPEVPEEEVHDQEDEQDRLEQGLDDLLDRHLHERASCRRGR